MKTIEIKEDGKIIATMQVRDVTSVSFAKDFVKIGTLLCVVEKARPFIYKDHNGVEVVEGQDIWSVFTADYSLLATWMPHKCIACKGEMVHGCKIFTTKEAADKFVAENTPKPFFVTHDGVAMEKGSKAFIVESEIFWKEPATVTVTSNNGKWLYFSTEQAANDYIKKKKLSLSLDMIEKWLIDDNFDLKHEITSAIYQSLTNLVNEQFKPQ